MLKSVYQNVQAFCLSGALVFLGLSGCNQQEAADVLEKSEQAVEDAAKTAGDEAEHLIEKGKEIATELSEQAQAYLNPIKEKFGNLDSLKETPEKLREALADMVQSMEDKAADVELPDSISNALTSIKEKMVALVKYLEGEYEQSQFNEKLTEIMESAKTAFGL